VSQSHGNLDTAGTQLGKSEVGNLAQLHAVKRSNHPRRPNGGKVPAVLRRLARSKPAMMV